jgi:hypothetical protein
MLPVQALALILLLQAPEAPSGAVVEPGSWSRLEFRARKGLVKGSVSLTARPARAEEGQAELRPWPDGTAREPAGGLIAFTTSTRATFRGHLERTTLMDDVGLVQDVVVEGKRRTTRRFGANGLHRWRERGGKVEEMHVTWVAPPDGRPIVDVAALLWLVTARRLDREGASLHVAVVSKGRRIGVDATAREIAEIESLAGAEARPVLARRVEIEPAEDDEEESVTLLGMQGGIDLYVEVGTGRPVEIRGKVPKIGRITARVVGAEP